MIIYHAIQDRCYFYIHTSSLVGHGKSNLASNDVEYIELPIVFVTIASTLQRIPWCY